jgi:hypothetical protein
MAVAVPKRRSSAPATAPPPSRTSPPNRKAAPKKGRPRKVDLTSGAAAPARAPARKPARKPAGKPAPARRKPARKAKGAAAPARKPARRAPARRVAAGGQLIPIAVGRSATAIRGLPDSGLVVRMTRGRLWIGVLAVLLVGIVGLNVVTLSFAASSGKVDERNTALEQENRTLDGRVGTVFGNGGRMRHEATALGLAMPTTEEPTVIQGGRNRVAEAAQRLSEME